MEVTEIPIRATRLHERGREAGGEGRYQEAVALFEAASALAPDWPYPQYDLAFTYLLQGDFPMALYHYRKTDELAPRGFFTTKTAIAALTAEAAGTIPEGVYLKYLTLEWTKDPAERDQTIEQILEVAPAFAPALKERALGIDDVEERLLALEDALACEPDPDTLGILVANRALALAELGELDDAVTSLEELIADESMTTAAVSIAKVTLDSLQQLR